MTWKRAIALERFCLNAEISVMMINYWNPSNAQSDFNYNKPQTLTEKVKISLILKKRLHLNAPLPAPSEILFQTLKRHFPKFKARMHVAIGFEYKDMKKDVFIYGHERPDVVEDRNNFLRLMDELKPYTLEFEEDGTMKPKKYPSDCAVGSEERRLIIVITHDECTFSANDGVQRVLTRIDDTFLRPKRRG